MSPLVLNIKRVLAVSNAPLLRSRAHLQQKDIVLNYKDSSGDLVEMTEQNDIILMRTEGIPPRRRSDSSTHAPWAIYVTKAGDYTSYQTDPYQR